MFEVVILFMTSELTQQEFDNLLFLVSQEKKERIKRFRFFQDMQNSLVSDIIVRMEICRITGYSNEELEFITNKYGKPFLAGVPHVQFNISHSGQYISVVVCDKTVGIDIEQIRPINLSLAERFFASDEGHYILNSRGYAQYQRFFEIWTKKESRIKWEGIGLSKSLSSFSVFDSTGIKEPIYNNVFQNNDVICHVCSATTDKPTIRIMDTTALVQYINAVYKQYSSMDLSI